MKNLVVFSLGLMGWWVCSVWAMGSDDPADWLKMMVEARKLQTYQGTFVYGRGDEMNSMHLLHRYKRGVEEERLVALDGAPREIVRRGDKVVCLLPGEEQVELQQTPLVGPFHSALEDIAPLKTVYSINVAGMERLAGYEVVKVAVMARDQFRYSYLLWLEKTTGLLIKSVLTGKDGKVLEHFQFTSLDIGAAISDKQIKGSISGLQIAHEAQSAPYEHGKSLSHRWQLGWLPPGFAPAPFVSKRNSVMPENTKIRVYSDGLAMFSVFVEPVADASMPEGLSKRGATTAHTKHVDHQGMVYVVTLVGEIPVVAAVKITNNIRMLEMEEAST